MTDHEACASTDLSTTRRVRFGPISEVVYDGSLSQVERDLLWHDPDKLREQARKEIQLARKVWKQNHGAACDSLFCFRGLEKRLRSAHAVRQKWLTFLQSFRALQRDLRQLENGTDDSISNLIMVFVSTHSKADRAKAHQLALQDEALAFTIHSEHQDNMLRDKKLYITASPATAEAFPQRSSTTCRRARSA
jgi:hypothetical protein